MNILQWLQKKVSQCKRMFSFENEFALKFSDHQYSKKLDCEIITLSMRFKRSGMTFPLTELAQRLDLIQQLHPLEAYLIGMLIAREKKSSYHKFIRVPIDKLNTLSLTSEMCKLLHISSLYEDHLQEKILTIKMKGTPARTIEMPLKDFDKIIGIIEFVSSEQACLIGQLIGEEIIQNIENNYIGVENEVA